MPSNKQFVEVYATLVPGANRRGSRAGTKTARAGVLVGTRHPHLGTGDAPLIDPRVVHLVQLRAQRRRRSGRKGGADGLGPRCREIAALAGRDRTFDLYGWRVELWFRRSLRRNRELP